MKSINRFLGIAAGVMIIVLIVASILAGIIISSNSNSFNGHFWDNSNVSWNFDWPWFNQEHSGDFETIVDEKSTEYEIPDNIYINVSINDVEFIEEERSNVLVEYFAEYPDTDLYHQDFSSEMTDDSLYINSNISISNLILDQVYDSYIKIHVPSGSSFNNLNLTLSMGEIEQKSILSNVDNLTIDAKMGNVNLDIQGPKNSVTLISSMGDIDVTILDTVDQLDISSSLGEVRVTLEGNVNYFEGTADMGNMEIDTTGTVEEASFTASMGNINGSFDGKVGFLQADCSMGNITLTVYDNEDSTVYADSSAGNVNVDLPMVKKSEGPDFELKASLGNIDLYTR